MVSSDTSYWIASSYSSVFPWCWNQNGIRLHYMVSFSMFMCQKVSSCNCSSSFSISLTKTTPFRFEQNNESLAFDISGHTPSQYALVFFFRWHIREVRIIFIFCNRRFCVYVCVCFIWPLFWVSGPYIISHPFFFRFHDFQWSRKKPLKWLFPKIGVPQNGWFIRENPMNKWMIWG